MTRPLTCAQPQVPVGTAFRLDLTAWALRRRAANLIDRWDDGAYSRVIVLGDRLTKLTVTEPADRAQPGLVISTSLADAGFTQTAHTQHEAERLVDTMFGLSVDLSQFYSMAATDTVLGPLVQQFTGVKPPRFPSIFEGLINAIACQQVSLDVGIVMLNRLSQRFGAKFAPQGCTEPLHAFPTPGDLSDVPPEAIRALGFSHQKSRAIVELAHRFHTSPDCLVDLDGMGNTDAVAFLSTFRGIGRWSAEYVLLRAMGRLDVFPGDDVGAQNNLTRLYGLDSRPGYSEIGELTARWRPFQGLAYFHLLLDKLHRAGAL
jgi:DNA-3-methyladenine glycosylase II